MFSTHRVKRTSRHNTGTGYNEQSWIDSSLVQCSLLFEFHSQDKTFDCRERSSLLSHSKSGGMGMKNQISLLSILTGEPEARHVVLWETICGSCKLLFYTILAVGVNAS